MSFAARVRTNPGIWAMVLGGVAALVAMFLKLLTLTGSQGSDTIRGVSVFTGQTILFCAILVILAGVGVAGSEGGGRIWWALLGLVFGLVIAVFGIMCVVSPESAAVWIASSQVFNVVMGKADTSNISDAYQAAFDAGTLTASVGIGGILTAIGGVVAVGGAGVSLFRKRRHVEPTI